MASSPQRFENIRLTFNYLEDGTNSYRANGEIYHSEDWLTPPQVLAQFLNRTLKLRQVVIHIAESGATDTYYYDILVENHV
jgi:hypothetical protein